MTEGAAAVCEVALIVIAKEPVPGRVKTRLCPPCSPGQAAAIAEAALRDALAAVVSTPARDRVLALEGRPGPWVPSGIRVVAQPAGGLGRRLAAAFAAVAGPAVLIGMDTPQVTPELLARAAEVLLADPVEAVLGPADDGGWWALGLPWPDPRVFDGVPMSAPDTHARQLDRLRELGYRPAPLPRLRDVDRFDDALAVARIAPGGAFAAAVRGVAGRVLAPTDA